MYLLLDIVDSSRVRGGFNNFIFILMYFFPEPLMDSEAKFFLGQWVNWRWPPQISRSLNAEVWGDNFQSIVNCFRIITGPGFQIFGTYCYSTEIRNFYANQANSLTTAVNTLMTMMWNKTQEIRPKTAIDAMVNCSKLRKCENWFVSFQVTTQLLPCNMPIHVPFQLQFVKCLLSSLFYPGHH